MPEYLVERLAPLSRDPVVIFGGHLLQIIGASQYTIPQREPLIGIIRNADVAVVAFGRVAHQYFSMK
jgi:hypothetical protein